MTTPTPSLKSDSPVILVSSDLGAPAVLRMPRTATGSVGAMRAPKTRHHVYGIWIFRSVKM